MPDEHRLLKFAQNLISTNSESPPGRERDVANIIRDHLESHGLSCISIGPTERPNLIFSTIDGEKGPLLLHGHMDTVPVGDIEKWNHDPFSAEIHNGLLYGRGACDMKGPVAALAETMIMYSESGNKTPLMLLCTSDEESGCSGAEHVAASGYLKGVRYGVCAEPTNLGVLVGEKGMLWTKIRARGKSAHGSRPSEGLNAINLCAKAIDVLSEMDYPYEPDALMGEMTFNVGLIEGGIKINVVPDYCEAQLDMRTVKGQDIQQVLEEMKNRLHNHGLAEKVEIEYIHGKEAVLTDRDEEIVRVALDVIETVIGRRPIPSAATYGTDCSVLQPKIGIINVICGPGSIEQAHQPNEFIRIDQLLQSVDVYLSIAEHIKSEP
ncbi:MAG: M20 family metallopeptidase [Candidatus Thorarchaeota archaeon]